MEGKGKIGRKEGDDGKKKIRNEKRKKGELKNRKKK
jgi:hypothetical protein